MTQIRSTAENQLVLVTSGSGFVGAYCILQLLNAGRKPAQQEMTPCPNEKPTIPDDQSMVKLGLLGDL